MNKYTVNKLIAVLADVLSTALSPLLMPTYGVFIALWVSVLCLLPYGVRVSVLLMCMGITCILPLIFLSVLRHLVRHGLIGDTTLHIYADADKSDEDHRKILRNSIVDLSSHVVIHRNSHDDEKDFGVPIDRIRETERVLW